MPGRGVVRKIAMNSWQAIGLNPFRFLSSAWPWRSLFYLGCGAFAALPAVLLVKWVDTAGTFAAGVVAVAGMVALSLVAAIPVAAIERRRLKTVNKEWVHLPHGHRRVEGAARRLRVRLGERATWREFGYTAAFTMVLSLVNLAVTIGVLGVLFAPLGGILAVVMDAGGESGARESSVDFSTVAMVVGVWLVMMPLAAYLITVLAACQGSLARLLLVPKDAGLADRVRELSRSRTRLVDGFEAERSRIERDLHDGAQQRLVALTMTLGMAELDLDAADGEARRLVSKARKEAEATLGELRELIRGIHPQVLTDRGIGAAVEEIATRTPIPVTVRMTLPQRPASAVEAVAYFVVSEALTNVAKHARASRAEVFVAPKGDRMVLTVTDDGIGGASDSGGSGLQGLADRVAVVGGTLTLTSPPGGPTELQVELPWHPDFE